MPASLASAPAHFNWGCFEQSRKAPASVCLGPKCSSLDGSMAGPYPLGLSPVPPYQRGPPSLPCGIDRSPDQSHATCPMTCVPFSLPQSLPRAHHHLFDLLPLLSVSSQSGWSAATTAVPACLQLGCGGPWWDDDGACWVLAGTRCRSAAVSA